jgi:hypothetical protein
MIQKKDKKYVEILKARCTMKKARCALLTGFDGKSVRALLNQPFKA